MTPARLSRRAAGGTVNAIARARAELTAAGVTLTDLSDSNPTRHGLGQGGVLPAVGRHLLGAGRYEPLPGGPRTAREALAARYGGDPDDYWLTSSTSQAYSWLLQLLADPGERVAIPLPGYPLVEPIARLTGVGAIGYRLHYVHPHGWVLDPASLARTMTGTGVRALVAVNPGNPTGAYHRAEEFLEVCERGRAVLIADEVFGPFALDGSVTTLAGEARVPTFTLGGVSKLLCAPQLKLAWIRISGPGGGLQGLREGLDTIADTFLPVSEPIAAALPDLLALADDCVGTVRARLAANLAAARALLAGGPYRVRRCEGGWTVLIDVPAYLPATDLVIHLMRHAHLAVHPGWFYDLPSEGALALSLLPAPDRFADGVVRLRAAVDDLADRAQ